MAKTKVEIHPQGLKDLLADNKGLRDQLAGVANAVKAYAESTASAAENGPGGRIDGYAAAGFGLRYVNGSPGRPGFEVYSNADGKVITAVHFYTQRRDGVAHLRKALYSQTRRG